MNNNNHSNRVGVYVRVRNVPDPNAIIDAFTTTNNTSGAAGALSTQQMLTTSTAKKAMRLAPGGSSVGQDVDLAKLSRVVVSVLDNRTIVVQDPEKVAVTNTAGGSSAASKQGTTAQAMLTNNTGGATTNNRLRGGRVVSEAEYDGVISSLSQQDVLRMPLISALPPTGTNADVFASTAAKAVAAAVDGIHSCVFAYGQTGSGKTHTLFGDAGNSDPGLIPRAVEELFELLHEKRDAAHPPSTGARAAGAGGGSYSFSVELSFVEIYMQKVSCLLSGKEDLHVRERASSDCGGGGAYVEQASVVRIGSPQEFHSVLQRGLRRRQVGSTSMNATSSRSHAIVQLSVKQWTLDPAAGQTIELSAVMNLVDLAGSERQLPSSSAPSVVSSAHHSSGARETNSINLSLLNLGKVINQCAAGDKFISYRESKLTQLLRENIGGNSVTFMVATVSPVYSCLQETCATLLYARNVRSIKMRPRQNKQYQMKADIQAAYMRLVIERDALAGQLSQQVQLCDRLMTATPAQPPRQPQLTSGTPAGIAASEKEGNADGNNLTGPLLLPSSGPAVVVSIIKGGRTHTQRPRLHSLFPPSASSAAALAPTSPGSPPAAAAADDDEYMVAKVPIVIDASNKALQFLNSPPNHNASSTQPSSPQQNQRVDVSSFDEVIVDRIPSVGGGGGASYWMTLPFSDFDYCLRNGRVVDGRCYDGGRAGTPSSPLPLHGASPPAAEKSPCSPVRVAHGDVLQLVDEVHDVTVALHFIDPSASAAAGAGAGASCSVARSAATPAQLQHVAGGSASMVSSPFSMNRAPTNTNSSFNNNSSSSFSASFAAGGGAGAATGGGVANPPSSSSFAQQTKQQMEEELLNELQKLQEANKELTERLQKATMVIEAQDQTIQYHCEVASISAAGSPEYGTCTTSNKPMPFVSPLAEEGTLQRTSRRSGGRLHTPSTAREEAIQRVVRRLSLSPSASASRSRRTASSNPGAPARAVSCGREPSPLAHENHGIDDGNAASPNVKQRHHHHEGEESMASGARLTELYDTIEALSADNRLKVADNEKLRAQVEVLENELTMLRCEHEEETSKAHDVNHPEHSVKKSDASGAVDCEVISPRPRFTSIVGGGGGGLDSVSAAKHQRVAHSRESALHLHFDALSLDRGSMVHRMSTSQASTAAMLQREGGGALGNGSFPSADEMRRRLEEAKIVRALKKEIAKLNGTIDEKALNESQLMARIDLLQRERRDLVDEIETLHSRISDLVDEHNDMIENAQAQLQENDSKIRNQDELLSLMSSDQATVRKSYEDNLEKALRVVSKQVEAFRAAALMWKRRTAQLLFLGASPSASDSVSDSGTMLKKEIPVTAAENVERIYSRVLQQRLAEGYDTEKNGVEQPQRERSVTEAALSDFEHGSSDEVVEVLRDVNVALEAQRMAVEKELRVIKQQQAKSDAGLDVREQVLIEAEMEVESAKEHIRAQALKTQRSIQQKTEEAETANLRAEYLERRLHDVMEKKNTLSRVMSSSETSSSELKRQLKAAKEQLSATQTDLEDKVREMELLQSQQCDDDDPSTRGGPALGWIEKIVKRAEDHESFPLSAAGYSGTGGSSPSSCGAVALRDCDVSDSETRSTIRVALRNLMQRLKLQLYQVTKTTMPKLTLVLTSVSQHPDTAFQKMFSQLRGVVMEMSRLGGGGGGARGISSLPPGSLWGIEEDDVALLLEEHRKRQVAIALLGLVVWFDHWEQSTKRETLSYLELVRNEAVVAKLARLCCCTGATSSSRGDLPVMASLLLKHESAVKGSSAPVKGHPPPQRRGHREGAPSSSLARGENTELRFFGREASFSPLPVVRRPHQQHTAQHDAATDETTTSGRAIAKNKDKGTRRSRSSSGSRSRRRRSSSVAKQNQERESRAATPSVTRRTPSGSRPQQRVATPPPPLSDARKKALSTTTTPTSTSLSPPPPQAMRQGLASSPTNITRSAAKKPKSAATTPPLGTNIAVTTSTTPLVKQGTRSKTAANKQQDASTPTTGHSAGRVFVQKKAIPSTTATPSSSVVNTAAPRRPATRAALASPSPLTKSPQPLQSRAGATGGVSGGTVDASSFLQQGGKFFRVPMLSLSTKVSVGYDNSSMLAAAAKNKSKVAHHTKSTTASHPHQQKSAHGGHQLQKTDFSLEYNAVESGMYRVTESSTDSLSPHHHHQHAGSSETGRHKEGTAQRAPSAVSAMTMLISRNSARLSTSGGGGGATTMMTPRVIFN